MKLSVIIPAYNEKVTIEIILQRVLEIQLDNLSEEIIVVDDASRNATTEILRRIEKEWALRFAHIFIPRTSGKDQYQPNLVPNYLTPYQ